MSKPLGGKLPNHILQSILIPKDHPAVKAKGLAGVLGMARKFGGTTTHVEEQRNYYSVRQVDPKLVQPGTYVTKPFPAAGGVQMRKALPKPELRNEPLTLQRGFCEVGTGKRRVVCHERYTDHGVTITLHTTKEQHKEVPKTASLGKLLKEYGPARVELKAPGPARAVPVKVPRGRAATAGWYAKHRRAG